MSTPTGNARPVLSLDARKWGDFGIGSYTRTCAQALARSSDHVQGRLLLKDNGPAEQELPELERVRVSGSDYGLRQHLSVPRAARGSAWLHCPHYVLPQGWRGPTIVTIHDLIHLRFPQWFGRGVRLYASALIRDAYRRADCVLTVSETVKRDLLARFGGPAERVRVIYNEVHPAFAASSRKIETGALQALPEQYVLAAGNHKPHKDLSLLVEALGKLQKRGLSIPLVLAGGSATQDLQVRARQQGVSCHALPHLPVEALAEVYRRARLLVHPSHYEGFGLPVAEAMTAGLPVLAARAGAVPEVGAGAIELFEAGRQTELEERLEDLWRDDARLEEQAQAGRKRARVFAPGSAVERLAELYQELLGSGFEGSQRAST